MGQISYTTEQLDNAIRKTLDPSHLSSYLPVATPYTTPSLSAGVSTKLLIPTTAKSVHDFSLDAGNNRWFLDTPDVVDREFSINMSSSMTASVNNTIVSVEMWKNGVLEEGVGIDRKIGTGSDVGALALTGTFKLSTNDYIEVYVKSSVAGTITFSRTAINIVEIN